jgi:hypothetical protein
MANIFKSNPQSRAIHDKSKLKPETEEHFVADSIRAIGNGLQRYIKGTAYADKSESISIIAIAEYPKNNIFRAYYSGEQTADGMSEPLCFSTDLITPGVTDPQHAKCDGCPKSSGCYSGKNILVMTHINFGKTRRLHQFVFFLHDNTHSDDEYEYFGLKGFNKIKSMVEMSGAIMESLMISLSAKDGQFIFEPMAWLENDETQQVFHFAQQPIIQTLIRPEFGRTDLKKDLVIYDDIVEEETWKPTPIATALFTDDDFKDLYHDYQK